MPTYQPVLYNDDDQISRMPRAVARSSATSRSPSYESSIAPSARLPSSPPTHSEAPLTDQPIHRPALTRPNTSHFTEADRFLETPKESFTSSRISSRRETYGGDLALTEFASGFPLSRPDANRTLSDLYPESIPGTPLARPSLLSLQNSGRASPVSSSWARSPYDSKVSFRQSHQSLIRLFPDTTSVYYDREWVKQGSIAKIHRRDDKDEWPNWKRYLYYTVPFLAIATLATYWAYFILRILCIISAQRQEKKPFPFAWVFVGVEISVAIPTFLQLFWSIFILRKRKRPKLRLVGNNVPTVDVFVTCCGEDVDLVMDTARAACDLDYPQDRFRVVILDDGNSLDLSRAVEELNAVYPNVAYRSRPKFPGVPHHFKAGNLNYGLEVVHEMPGGASRYIAALDADMIPEQHWLRAIMPHMLEDDKIALACPPQVGTQISLRCEISLTRPFSFSITFLLGIHCARAWISSFTYLSPSKMPWV